MKLVFGAQGTFTKIFFDAYQNLKKNKADIKSCIFFTADAHYYYANNLDQLSSGHSDIQVLKEWDFTCKKNIQLENSRFIYLKNKYKDTNLWNAVVCDRRLMYGADAKFIQNYTPRFDHKQLQNIIYHTLDRLDFILSKDEKICVITPIPACYYDYLLYLCAKKNKKDYLQLKFTKVENRVIFSQTFSGNCPEEIDKSYNKNLNQDIPDTFHSKVEEYLINAKKEKQLYEGVILQNKLLKDSIIEFGRDVWGGTLKKYLLPKLWTRLKDPHVPPFTSNVTTKYFYKPIRKWRINYIIKKRNITLSEMKKGEYYFYPMHSEPEISISVHGKKWQNQIELIRKIAQSIPLGAGLVIKEHPRNLGYRSISYYKALLQIPNLYFIDSNYSTYSVIKNSQLVFVLSGFVGFEAIILKKPVIVFGDTMYGCLPDSMIRKCINTSNLSEVIKDLVSNYQYSSHNLKSYLSAVYENTEGINFYSSLLGKKGRHSVGDNISYNEEIKILSKFIYKKLR
tara:strand:+ start:5262 stop:6788 length:1527 start_codon:yes stop_codon:yes gene_type:complete